MNKFNNPKVFWIVFGIVGIGAVLLFSGVLSRPSSSSLEGNVSSAKPQASTAKQFTATIQNFAYSPESIDVELGDTVIIDITNKDNVRHGIALPGFGVNSFVNPGSTQRIQFVADKTGNPETFCSTDHGEKLLINVSG